MENSKVIRAKKAIIDNFKVKHAKTDDLRVNDGIELTDVATGKIWCVRIVNGEFDKQEGGCGSFTNNTPVVPATPASDDASQITDQTQSANPVDSETLNVDGSTNTATSTE